MSLAEDFMLAKQLREKLRGLEESISRRANHTPVTAEDERAMLGMQSRADASYQAVGLRAPPPLPLERPAEYRRRIVGGLKEYSPRWRDSGDISALKDDALDAIEPQIYADAISNRTYGMRPGEIRPRETITASGHRAIEYDGGDLSWFGRQFHREPRRAVLKSMEQYAAMSRDVNMARIQEIIRHRPIPQPVRPHAGF